MATGGVAPIKWGQGSEAAQGSLALSRVGSTVGNRPWPNTWRVPGTYSIEVKVTDSTKKHHQTQSVTLPLQIQS